MEEVKKRKYSIDLLRVISMIGIIMIHVINQGGVLKNIDILSANYVIINILNTLVMCSVNLFAMISGYLYIKKNKFNYKSIVNLILTVFFYSVIITIIFYGFNLFNVRQEGIKRLVYSLFPAIAGRYWYITCYVFLFFMIPYMNKFILNFEKDEFRNFIFVTFILFSALSMFGVFDFFRINSGYSPFWLIYCYFVGAYIKLHPETTETKKLLVILISLILMATFLNYVAIIIKVIVLKQSGLTSLFIVYNSPLILCASIIIFKLFVNYNMERNHILEIASKTSFGVYIIHGNMLIYDFVLKNRFAFLSTQKTIIILIGIIVISVLIYIVCAVIDQIRIYLFKIFNIKSAGEFCDKKIKKILLEGERGIWKK